MAGLRGSFIYKACSLHLGTIYIRTAFGMRGLLIVKDVIHGIYNNKYGLNRYDLEDSIEEYAITWWVKAQKKDQVTMV